MSNKMLKNVFQSSRKLSSRSNNYFSVTTPIFYVNAAPHIGHLYSAVIADAISRYKQLKYPSTAVNFFTGTDEHGTKIQQAAALHETSVEEYCNKISGKYRDLFGKASVDYSDFIRTTEDRHKIAVQHLWSTLKSRGHIYSSEYSGWYCTSDETFLTDSQLKVNPDGSKLSLESGHSVEWTEEVNYMFSLNKFQNEIIYWVKKGNKVKPEKFEKILLHYLEEPLPDISVSRPASRVHWGVPVPEDDTQTIYVWLDALVNYLTCAGYPGEQYIKRWPPSLHVIGKDILKFHGIYWPAFLIAAGLDLPQGLLVHSHWTVDGQKMSKSKLNVVDPFDRAEICTFEALRYFLLREGVPHSDGNYSDVKILRILNSELADTLGNLLSRGCAKSLNPRQIFPRTNEQQLNEILKLDAAKRLMSAITQLPEKCAQHYDSYNFYLVVDEVMATLHAANNFFESCKPWELKKPPHGTQSNVNTLENNNNPSDVDENTIKLETIVSITMDTLRKCAIILNPIIPNISSKLLDKLAVPSTERSWSHLKLSVWDAAFDKREKHLGKLDAILFRRIIQDDKGKVRKCS